MKNENFIEELEFLIESNRKKKMYEFGINFNNTEILRISCGRQLQPPRQTRQSGRWDEQLDNYNPRNRQYNKINYAGFLTSLRGQYNNRNNKHHQLSNGYISTYTGKRNKFGKKLYVMALDCDSEAYFDESCVELDRLGIKYVSVNSSYRHSELDIDTMIDPSAPSSPHVNKQQQKQRHYWILCNYIDTCREITKIMVGIPGEDSRHALYSKVLNQICLRAYPKEGFKPKFDFKKGPKVDITKNDKLFRDWVSNFKNYWDNEEMEYILTLQFADQL